MTVKAEISEADVVKVKPGMPVYFTVLGAPDTRYEGTLRSVSPAPETITSSDTSAKTISSSATYYNGEFEVSIVLGEAKHALSIPLSVLGEAAGSGRYQVRVLSDGQPETRVISTGLKDNIYVQVLGGLKEGDRVIVGDTQTAAKATASENRMRGPMGGRP